MAEMNDREILIGALRDAVDALYNCRYPEQPLAKRLDALLMKMTGKTNADITRERVLADPVLSSMLAAWCRMPTPIPSPPKD